MSTKVVDPNAKGNSGFFVGLGVLLLIIVGVIGYIVWQGQGAKTAKLAEHKPAEVALTMQVEGNGIALSSEKATKDTPTVELYEDFSCPHCGELAKATDGEMLKAIENGELNVTIHPLNFLDGKDLENNSGHSTKGVAAMMALAKSGDVKTYWALRSYLMENQKEVYNKWEMKDFANAAKELGADSETVKAMENADIKELGNKIAAENAKKLQDETGSLSSPRIIYNGKDLVGDNENLNEWVKKAVALKK